MKILKAKANNLESNLHIEIDMERLEDSSKALSFIGIEISDALKLIPAPEARTENIEEEVIQENNVQEVQDVQEKRKKVKNKVKANVQTIEENENVQNATQNDVQEQELEEYKEQTTFKTKTSFWQKIKNSKIFRAATYVFRIRIRIELPSNALPEGRGEEN